MKEKSQTNDRIIETIQNDNSITTKDRSKLDNKASHKKRINLDINSSKRVKKQVEEVKDIDSQSKPIESNTNNIKSVNNIPIPDSNSSDQEISKKKRAFGRILILIIVLIIIFEYYIYVFEMKLKNIKSHNYISTCLCLVTFHFLYLMMLWSLIVTMGTYPGEIPLYWGFYIGDDEYKRKRYCLICNAFKPERSHHCSVCNSCVLNMDHHCPWVNNCIGFYNRKFFMQLLFYLLIVIYFVLISGAHDIYNAIMLLYKSRHSVNYKLLYECSLIFIAYGIILVISVLNTLFFKFHIKLVLQNTTTIESLDTEFVKKNKFKLSFRENWEQVFGKSKLLWFFPILISSGFPVGDGLTWKTNSFMESITQSSANSKSKNAPLNHEVFENDTQHDYNSNINSDKINVIKNYHNNEMKKRNNDISSNMNNLFSNDNPIDNYYSTNVLPVKGNHHIEMVKFNTKVPDDDPINSKKINSFVSNEENDNKIQTPKAH